MSNLQEIKVPDIGTSDEVDVVEVLIKPGDTVAPEDPLITIESEKSAMDMPSPLGGVVREIHLAPGDKVSQGSLVLTLEIAEEPSENSAGSEAAASQQEAKPGRTDSQQKTPGSGDDESAQSESPGQKREASPADDVPITVTNPEGAVIDAESLRKAHASPSVRQLARELGINLAHIQGSGAKQRILRDDVKKFVKQRLKETPQQSHSGIPPIPVVDFSCFGPTETVALHRIRKLTGEALHRSWLNIPHVTQFDEADITELEAFRRQEKENAAASGIRLTTLAFLLKACARNLLQHPNFNASLHPDGAQLILKKYCHIGVAVETPKGLVVPVVRDVAHKGVFELAGELEEISRKAREGRMPPDAMKGGCFTISSLGGIGGTAFTPIINAPEVAILGVSRHQYKPVYQNGEFIPRLMLPLSLSYDHRVIDGADAARFIVELSRLLADIRRLML